MNHSPTLQYPITAKRSQTEISAPIFICIVFTNLIWGYDYALIFPNIIYASDFIYAIGTFIIAVNICNGLFILLTPRYKVDAEYIYLYGSFLEFKKIQRSQVNQAIEIKNIFNQKGVKLILNSGKEIHYFPYEQHQLDQFKKHIL